MVIQAPKLEISETSLKGLLLLKPPPVYEDVRGCNVGIYKRNLYQDAGIDMDFVQDDIFVSERHVLKGIHGDGESWRMVSCLFGKLYFVVVDWDEESAQRGEWESFVLSDLNRHQVLIPPKFGGGYLVLSQQGILLSKRSKSGVSNSRFSLTWNDPKLGIWWPVKSPLVSNDSQFSREA